MMRLMLWSAPLLRPNVDQRIINVGSGEETSLDQLIEAIGATLNARANVLYNTDASPGIGHLVADLTLARQLLKYKPRVSLAEGLRRFVESDPRFGRAAVRAGIVQA